MDQASIIKDLLFWLDNHLESPLTLDHVAAKSGYSKWHLQRMFKEVTGQAIGSYIRKRRLSKSAVALRLTGKSILEIALQYHFDSQQTFTRAFKKQFNQTPAYYRRINEWNMSCLCPAMDLLPREAPNVEYVTLPEKQLLCMNHPYTCSLPQIGEVLLQYRVQFWQNYLPSHIQALPNPLYGLHHAVISRKLGDEQQVFYTTAIDADHEIAGQLTGELITVPAQYYACFHYHGPMNQLQQFVLNLYSIWLPEFNLTRVKGYDIEMFHPKLATYNNIPDVIKCNYYIPIKQN